MCTDNSSGYTVTRGIGIDAGHRITHHNSKCKNVHGHRYTIRATCRASNLHTEGSEEGMVLDFGFLKDLMMKHIDAYCDHAMIFWRNDNMMCKAFMPYFANNEDIALYWDRVDNTMARHGWFSGQGVLGKFYVIPYVPTAENLARHWFERMQTQIGICTQGRVKLDKIEVWETPNCCATYPVK